MAGVAFCPLFSHQRQIETRSKLLFMVKVGIIRCAGTHQEYPGTGCFKTTRGTGGKFSEYSDQDIEIIGMADCGGCPGRDAASVAANMVKKGA
jgi:hypothetical protein